MAIYLSAPIITIVSGFLFSGNKISIDGKTINRVIIILLSFLVPFYIYGFRSVEIGIDTWSYANDFHNIANSNIKTIIYNTNIYEIGFTLLCYSISLIKNDTHIFLLGISIVINSLYIRAIYRSNNDIIVSILAYLYLGNFLYNLNIMRQAIAVSILSNAILELQDGYIKRYIILVLLATTIHTSAIGFLFIPIPLNLIRKKDSLKHFLLILFIGILLSLKILNIIANQIFTRYIYYFDKNWNSEQRIGVTAFAYIFLEIAIVIILVRSFEDDMQSENNKKIVIYSIIMVCASATLIMMPVLGIYERISKYFSAMLVFSIPFTLSIIKKRKNKQILQAIFFISSTIYYLYIFGIDAYSLIPFIPWNKQI